ncbi:Proteasome subunit alpha 1 [Cladochytrium tenue]|nr:Proteasome subunit alpha 1 [Cladochytrium tenue]
MIYDRPLPVQRISAMLGDKAQMNTQRYGRRPYGVGLLIAGVDEAGPHLYEVAPSGNYFDYYAISIGSRSQSAKTYLEKHVAAFAECSADELALHGLRALRDTLQQDKELTPANCSVAVVGGGAGGKFESLGAQKVEELLALLAADAPQQPPPAGSGDGAEGADAPAAAEAEAMDTE